MPLFIVLLFALAFICDTWDRWKKPQKKEAILSTIFLLMGFTLAMFTVFDMSWINPITLVNRWMHMIFPMQGGI